MATADPVKNAAHQAASRKRRGKKGGPLKAIQLLMRESDIADLLDLYGLPRELLKDPTTQEMLGNLLYVGASLRKALRPRLAKFELDDLEV